MNQVHPLNKPLLTRKSGFTLTEISIVVLIIATISAMGIVASSGMIESSRKVASQTKLDEIENALSAFRQAYGRLPCPANVKLPKTSSNFGFERAIANYSPTTSITANFYNCIDTNDASATANFYWGGQNNSVPAQIAEGAVPVRTLGLPDDFAYDGWGNKIMYSVDAYATTPNAFTTMRPESNCSILVNDQNGSARTAGAVYVLLSYGQNGHGGFKDNATRYSSGSNQADEKRNCHCSSSASTDATFSYTD
ncbi:MAG: type II secretion system protein [Rickettsiales bacterium]|nr:type II secretion system protein [Rickettsiales bacterium]